MKKPLLDDHLIGHDAFTLGFAVSSGILGGMVTRSALVGTLMAVTVFTLGIASMRVRRLRRAVNRLASTLGRS